MKKIYLLDTNIYMQSSTALFGFEDNDIYITTTILQELDKHKTDLGESGFNVRETIRTLEELRREYVKTHKQGDFDSLDLPNGGKLFVIDDAETNYLPKGCSLEVADNRIINTVIELTQKKNIPVILVTNDGSMRFNAFKLSNNSIIIQDYLNETLDHDDTYTGKTNLVVDSSVINKLYAEGSISVEEINQLGYETENYIENEFIHITTNDTNQSAMSIYQNGFIKVFDDKKLRGFNNVHGKNLTQKELMYALLAPADEIPLVICKGPAGTGKTFLAIACGLDGTYDSKAERIYDQVMITRTNVLSDNDLGFLPGDLEEKMSPLVAPFMDNMLQIFAGHGKDRDLSVAKQQIDYVIQKEYVKIVSVGYMRGRSVPNTYLIVDEAQNMTVSQALEIVSRAGMGTKVVLLGDPDQIDARYLSKRNNGLVFTANKMKGSKLCAQITFDQEESVRSPLAMEAAKRLTVHMS